MSTPVFLLPLVLVFLAALAAAYAANRLRQPPLIGFLVAGALLGPYGLKLVSDVRVVEELAGIGVVLLLFTVGLELSFSSLGRLGRLVWVAGPIQLFGVIGVATAAAVLRGYPLRQGVLFGFIVSTCSTVILLKLLADRGELDSPHGSFLVGINLFGDLMVVPMMLLLPALAGRGGGALATALALGKAAATVFVTLLLSRRLVPRFLAAVVSTRQKELFIVAVLVLVFGTALATSAAGLSLALGAFLAGLVVSESEYGHQAVADVSPFRDSFSALFFVSVGMLFSPSALMQHPGRVAGVLLLVLVAKSVFAAAPALLLGYGPRVAMIVGLSLAQIGEFSFVLLEAGRRVGMVATAEYQVLLAAVILSMVATPFLFEGGHTLGAALSRILPGRGAQREGERSGGGSELPSENHALILGFGHMGETLARVFGRADVPFRILELNPDRVRGAAGRGLPIQYGDATNDRVLLQAGVDRARAIVVVLAGPRAAPRAGGVCRRLAPGGFLLVRTRYLTEIPELSALGADDVVAEEFETALEIAGRALSRLGLSLPWVEAETEEIRQARHDGFRRFRVPGASPEAVRRALGGTRVEFLAVGSDWFAAGRSLAQLDLRSTGGTVLAVVRGGKPVLAPGGSFEIEPMDQILLLGTDSSIEKSVTRMRG